MNRELTQQAVDFIAIERGIAETARARLLSARQTREQCWMPAAREIIEKSVVSTEALTHLMRFIEETLSQQESYNVSNIGMEILRMITITSPPTSSKTEAADRAESKAIEVQPYFRAAVFVYDPFVKGVQQPTLSSVKRIFLDTSVETSEVEPLFSFDLTEEQKAVIAGFAIPQSMPGLGFLSASTRNPICDLQGLKDIIEKTNGVEVTASLPLDPLDREGAHYWLREVTKELRIRILFINLASNIPSRSSCLIKYRMEALEADGKMRGRVVTPEMIGALSPFEFPPSVLPNDGIFGIGEEGTTMQGASTTVQRPESPPYLMFGECGPLFVFLDYRYGSKRYLLVGSALSPDSTVRSFRHIGPPPPSEDDLHATIGMQHAAFMAKYFPSPSSKGTSDDAVIPSRGSIIYEKPLPGIDVATDAFRVAKIYMKRFIETVELSIPTSSRRLREAFITMYEDKMSEAISSDIIESIDLFSPTSQTFQVLNAFEMHFLPPIDVGQMRPR